jgi:hypothetical protein
VVVVPIKFNLRDFASGYSVQQAQAALDIAVRFDGHGLPGKLCLKQSVQRFRRKTPKIA